MPLNGKTTHIVTFFRCESVMIWVPEMYLSTKSNIFHPSLLDYLLEADSHKVGFPEKAQLGTMCPMLQKCPNNRSNAIYLQIKEKLVNFNKKRPLGNLRPKKAI